MKDLILKLSQLFLKEASQEKNLYHGTSVDKIESIKNLGLIPKVGDWVKDSYGPSFDLDPNSEDYQEWENKPVFDLVFLTDKGDLTSSVGGMKKSISVLLGKPFQDVSEDDIENFGVIVVLKKAFDPTSDSNFFKKAPGKGKKFEKWQEENSKYLTVEPGDYFYEGKVSIDQILTGKQMVSLLRNNFAWPLTTTEKGKREDLIRFYLKSGKPILEKIEPSKSDVIAFVNNLTKEQVDQEYIEAKKFLGKK